MLPASRRRLLQYIALLPLFSACGKKTNVAAVPSGSVVLAFGDSVTFGTGAGPGDDWPTLLAAATGWRVINAGVPGETAEVGKERIGGLLQVHRPALVIVEIGGNDFLRRRPQSAVKEDVRAIVRQVKASGAQVVLVAVPELSLLGAVTRRLSDAAIYAELGKEEQVALIPDVFSGVLAQPELRADQIHPNAAGYRKMAEAMAVALGKTGLLR